MNTYERLCDIARNINREGLGMNLALVKKAISHHLGDSVTVEESGPEWPSTEKTRYYAQVNSGSMAYAFGSTPMRAISNLLQQQ